jgi:rubrerythrin
MTETMILKKKWRCTVCGYVCEAEEPPESCPECYAPKEAFVEE